MVFVIQTDLRVSLVLMEHILLKMVLLERVNIRTQQLMPDLLVMRQPQAPVALKLLNMIRTVSHLIKTVKRSNHQKSMIQMILLA